MKTADEAAPFHFSFFIFHFAVRLRPGGPRRQAERPPGDDRHVSRGPTERRRGAEPRSTGRARSAVPLTLPSHTTILTGELPTVHGVRENGVTPLAASHPTIATLLKGAGYDTAAFVGAFVLDRAVLSVPLRAAGEPRRRPRPEQGRQRVRHSVRSVRGGLVRSHNGQDDDEGPRSASRRSSASLCGRANVEAIGEVFNLFNTINPSGFRARVNVPTTGAPDPNLLQPTTFSGDAQRPEQRVGQIGFRFSF